MFSPICLTLLELFLADCPSLASSLFADRCCLSVRWADRQELDSWKHCVSVAICSQWWRETRKAICWWKKEPKLKGDRGQGKAANATVPGDFDCSPPLPCRIPSYSSSLSLLHLTYCPTAFFLSSVPSSTCFSVSHLHYCISSLPSSATLLPSIALPLSYFAVSPSLSTRVSLHRPIAQTFLPSQSKMPKQAGREWDLFFSPLQPIWFFFSRL